MKRYAAALALPFLLLVGCKEPEVVGTLPVKVDTDPAAATIVMKGKQMGAAPQTVKLVSVKDLPFVNGSYQGLEPVERRIRYLPDGSIELKLLFGADRSPMAKLLGLPRVLVFEFAAGLTFDVNKFDLKPTTLPLLERQASLLKEQFAGVDVHVLGHTDSTGNANSNKVLSVNRAQAVADYLASQGIEKTRLRIQGLAADYPVAPNSTEDGRTANRRTELILAQ